MLFVHQLVPIMQENNDVLLRNQRFNPKDREYALQEIMQKWRDTTSLTIKLLLSNINDPSAGFLTRWISKAYANATATWGLNHAGESSFAFVHRHPVESLITPV